jgi:obg-like ATPase 1
LTYVKAAVDAENKAVKASGGKYKLTSLFTDTMEKMKTMLEANIPVRSGF